MKWFGKIDSFIERICSGMLVFTVFVIIFLSVSLIVLRWIQISIPGFDLLVRHLVFLSAFLGGVLATGRKTHISMDILTKYLKKNNLKKYERILQVLINLVAVITLVFLIKASLNFLFIEWEYAKEVFFGVHSGWTVAIIPIGLTLIALRFLFQLAQAVRGEGI